ncbi:tripartite ATP-independent transporter DctP family solute receptor [Sinobacterium caligoides]|uniref:Tripartite ATP-independent transporter DctP family solute receptor n=1 Tax=Sinobacterium caligoides TaxID=933926 RepID=A0A3N2DK79_9GAMM|nr:DctP family TRAP transporter solute-binding subunit [Sinobacterium caligoides]ROS00187.1 tripartite ATP-independent transporter DctP family solute receptor [Sinobacterium caligoides]
MKRILLAALLSAGLSAAAFGQTVIKFAHDNREDILENPAHAFAGTFKSIVEAESNGQILVEMYPMNQLGSDREHLSMLRKGIIQATLTSSGAMGDSYPRMELIDLPFAFNSSAAAYRVWDGPFGDALAADMEDTLKDIKVLGFPDSGGFYSFTNSKRPITKLEDFEGIRLRTMKVPAQQVMVNSIGAQAYPMSWGELYTGLQRGMVDGQMNPLSTISVAKLYETQKYLTVTNHLFTPYVFSMNKKLYDSINEEEKRIIARATRAATVAGRGVALAIENSKTKGLPYLAKRMKTHTLSQKERERMRAVSQPAVKKMLEEEGDNNMKQLLSVYLSEINKANAQY